MKRIASLIDKLKLCKYWLFNYGDVLIESCHYCNSTRIAKVEGSDDGDAYNAKYLCKNCGATCITKENWNISNTL